MEVEWLNLITSKENLMFMLAEKVVHAGVILNKELPIRPPVVPPKFFQALYETLAPWSHVTFFSDKSGFASNAHPTELKEQVFKSIDMEDCVHHCSSPHAIILDDSAIMRSGEDLTNVGNQSTNPVIEILTQTEHGQSI
ncbi:hypothetical protein SELMODRAFT_404993 [Selaginella moellendorffii]|uniref:Uncharacterized protein n=1 Tax=Selaginella moellendorffii TaxID=88036 RepID=D8QY14_SELML|nr:hypothetical protein SELMODRAFT_404993 [Selaginella moellendorffii]